MDDHQIMAAIRDGNEQVFQKLFYDHYGPLYRNAFQYVNDAQVAEELVQDAFVNFWEKRLQFQLKTSIKAYLFVSVRNLSLNYLKSRYANAKSLHIAATEVLESKTTATDHAQELEHLLQKGIDLLPEKCKIIFNLSRGSGMTYQEIATELGVSKETVKSQIKIAIKKLQQILKEHWYVWLLFFVG